MNEVTGAILVAALESNASDRNFSNSCPPAAVDETSESASIVVLYQQSQRQVLVESLSRCRGTVSTACR
jgi:hypothetical protein